MWELPWIVLVPLGIAVSVLAILRASRDAPADFGCDPIEVGPDEPCWTEEIRREDGLILSRGECVNDMLMETDRRAGLGQFPIPRGDG